MKEAEKHNQRQQQQSSEAKQVGSCPGFLQIAIRLIGGFGGALNYWHHFANSGKEISLVSDPEDSVAMNFLKLMNGDPAFKVK